MSAIEANDIFDTVTAGVEFSIPTIDITGPEYEFPGGLESGLYEEIERPGNSALTTKTVGGNGTFDWIMSSLAAHLHDEYAKGRITGAEYTKAYIAFTEAALSGAIQFLLARETTYWQGLTAQVAAIKGKVDLATAKMQFASTQAQATTLQAQYATAKMQLPVLDKQRDLIMQQITSYQRDAETKAAKLFADGWTVQKTIDEGLIPPTALTNSEINTVLQKIKTNNGLV